MGNNNGERREGMPASAPAPVPTYVVGDATNPFGEGPRIIAHICNDVGRWGRGFVMALSRRWPEPEQAYRQMWRTFQEVRPDRTKNARLLLGDVQFVAVADELWVANMIGQRGIFSTDARPPIRYSAVAVCLMTLAEEARRREASVHMPRIGVGLAGGTWQRIGPIVEEELCARGVAVTVYDLADAAPRQGNPSGR